MLLLLFVSELAVRMHGPELQKGAHVKHPLHVRFRRVHDVYPIFANILSFLSVFRDHLAQFRLFSICSGFWSINFSDFFYFVFVSVFVPVINFFPRLSPFLRCFYMFLSIFRE